jgi:uncharacterized protein
MTIGIDIDGVLADSMPKFLEFYNNLHNTSFVNEHFHTYNWGEVFGTTKEKALEIYDSFCNAGHLKNLDIMAGAVAGIKKIKGKHELVVITGRAMTQKNDTEYWLQKHFPDSFAKIFYIRKRILDPVIKNKFEICKEVKADIMIEDDIEYVNSFTARGTKILLFNHPWNQNVGETDNLVRVHSWEQIVEKINNY